MSSKNIDSKPYENTNSRELIQQSQGADHSKFLEKTVSQPGQDVPFTQWAESKSARIVGRKILWELSYYRDRGNFDIGISTYHEEGDVVVAVNYLTGGRYGIISSENREKRFNKLVKRVPQNVKFRLKTDDGVLSTRFDPLVNHIQISA